MNYCSNSFSLVQRLQWDIMYDRTIMTLSGRLFYCWTSTQYTWILHHKKCTLYIMGCHRRRSTIFHQAWRIQVAIAGDMMRCPRDCGLSFITRGNHPRNRGITEDGTAQDIRCSVLFAVVFGRYKTCTVGVVGVVSSRIRKGGCAP